MMNSENSAVYSGLGFPIKVINPRYIEFRGEKILDVNPKKLMKTVFKAVINKPARLSGSEVKFLRGFMEMTQEDFANLIGVDRTLISKWQDKKEAFTGMDVQKEVILRAQCASFLHKKDSFKKDFFDEVIARIRQTEEVGETIVIQAPAA